MDRSPFLREKFRAEFLRLPRAPPTLSKKGFSSPRIELSALLSWRLRARVRTIVLKSCHVRVDADLERTIQSTWGRLGPYNVFALESHLSMYGALCHAAPFAVLGFN